MPQTQTTNDVSPYAKPGPYVTSLTSDEEEKFRKWIKENKIPWQDGPKSDYDMRGYWKAQQKGDKYAKTEINHLDHKPHYPDTWKTPYHRTFSNESMYALPTAPHWEGDKLVPTPQQIPIPNNMPRDPNTPYDAAASSGQGSGGSQQFDFLSYFVKNKDALAKMDPDKALKLVDRVFKRFVLPKYQKVNQQKPLSDDSLEKLRLQFTARMFNIPTDQQTPNQDDQKKPTTGEKAVAGVEGAGAGVLGGVKTIAELYKKIQDHLGPIGVPAGYVAGKVAKYAGQAEGKAYEDASLRSPGAASVGAAIGHQIPASIASGGVGSVLPAAGAGASTAAKLGVGALRGAAEGSTFEASRPGGQPGSGAVWGGLLGAAFPALGKLFGLGKKAATPVAEAASTTAATEAPKTMGDVADSASKSKFGKPFKDLTPAEKVQMPAAMKEEILKQQVIKNAKAKAEKAAAKAAKEVTDTTKRAEKAAAATAKAGEQASRRAEVGGTPVAKQAVAAQAAAENPDTARIMASFKQGEGAAANAPGQVIKTNPSQDIESAKHEFEKAKGILKNSAASPEEKRIAKDNYRFWQDKLKGIEGGPKVTKVPEGATGPKVRASEGQPASPAQQASDRERIAKSRAESKQEDFGSALEKKAQEMAGKYTSATQIGVQHIPELEATVKELEGGDVVIKGLQKLRRAKKISDDIYADSLKEWIMNQLGGK